MRTVGLLHSRSGELAGHPHGRAIAGIASAPAGSVGPVFADVFDQLADLVLPRSCVGCGAAAQGAALCPRCLPSRRPELVPARNGMPVLAAVPYAGPVRAVLLRYKERGRRDLVRVLAVLLGQAVDAFLARVARPAGGAGAVVLVPVPSSRVASAARGGDHVVRLARRAGPPRGLPVSRGLVLTRAVRDAASLTASERARNIACAMAARPPPGGLSAGVSAVLVDDIVTTGSTLLEAERALTVAGWPVLGAAVIAATARRHRV